MKTSGFNSMLAMIGIYFLLTACNQTTNDLNINAEKQLVENAIHNSIGWAKNKDIGLLYGTIANDTNYIEVDPNDRIVRGFKDFRKAEEFWMSDDFKAIHYDIKDLKISFSKSGEVAWFFCLLNDMNEWKGQPANWENTRWTGVLEKRDNNWIIVQMHFSFASN